MKKLTVILMAATLCCGCVSQKSSTKVERFEQDAQLIQAALNEHKFTVEVDHVYPSRFPAQHLDYGYEITVRNDSLISYLPYFGRAYSLPYGGGKGLNFKARISQYQTKRNKKDLTRIDLTAQNEEDIYQYQVEIFDNGSADIQVLSRQRESIRFTGTFKK